MNAHEWNLAVLASPAEHLARLEQTGKDNGISALPAFTRPVIGDAADLEPISRDLPLIQSAITRLVRGWARGTAGEHVQLAPDVASLARAAIAREQLLGFTRYDVVYGAGQRDFRVLECQAGDPSGAGWIDALTRGFHQAHGLRRYLLLDALVGLIRAQLPALERPKVAFVCASDSFVRTDHLLMARDCSAAGMRCSVADVRQLVRKPDGLYLDGERIDLCLRDTIDELVLEPWREAGKVLLDAWRDGLVEVLNPFGAIVADDKSLFEALSTGTFDFTAEEQAALKRRIPWTRVLKAGLRAEALERRAGLVLKPADGYGGFGVVIGAECDQEQWRSHLDQALESPKAIVLQQYLPLPEEELPVFSGGAVSLQRLRVVGSFWWINDRFAGAFHRASPDRVINVHQGGGLTPTFFAES